MDFLQQLIHRLEVGGGKRLIRTAAAVLGLVLLAILYDTRGPVGFESREAMEMAQLARNLSTSFEYTTSVVTPLSTYLADQANANKVPEVGKAEDRFGLRYGHPDFSTPPVYPFLEALLMKALPFKYDSVNPFAGEVFQPDVLIAIFNQILFGGVILLAFLVARRLFDNRVAVLTVVLLLGTELLWRFTTSGLPTILLLLVFLALTWSLLILESEGRESTRSQAVVISIAAFAGILVGLGGMARYSFAILILPVVLFLAIFGGRQRVVVCLACFLAFAAAFGPWLLRNGLACGAPFGARVYSAMRFDDGAQTWERFPQPPVSSLKKQAVAVAQKIKVNMPTVLKDDLLKLGGNWVTALFLVGLLVGFGPTPATRLRYFLLLSLVSLIVAQAGVRTLSGSDPPAANPQDLLVIVAPLVFAYGVSLFYALLDLVELPVRELRYTIVGAFVAITCLPMLLLIVQRANSPFSYFRYPARPETFTKDGLIFTDIPWMTAWYGNRQSLLLLPSPAVGYTWASHKKDVDAIFLSHTFLEKVTCQSLSYAALEGDRWEALCFNPIQAFSANRRRPEWRESWPKLLNVNLWYKDALTYQEYGLELDRLAPLPLTGWQKGWPSCLLLTRPGLTAEQLKGLKEGKGPLAPLAAERLHTTQEELIRQYRAMRP